MTISVTQAGVYVELSGPATVVTQAGVYTELGGPATVVTQAGIYTEIYSPLVRVTQAAVYVELILLEVEEEMPTYFASSAGSRAIHHRLPEEQTGYAFDPSWSWWSSVVPEESENLIINSSFELGVSAGGWQSDGTGESFIPVNTGTIGATHLKTAMRLSTNDANAVFYTEGIAVEAGTHTFALDIYVTRPCVLYLFIQDDTEAIGATGINAYNYVGVKREVISETGWKRYHVSGAFLSAADARVGIFVEAATSLLVYMDALQLEAKPYPTTYIHGDMIGSKDTAPRQSYYWRGAADESRAVRRKRTGSGGRIVSWSEEAGFMTTSIVGAGMSPVDIETQEVGDGRTIHLRTRAAPGNFSVIGRVFGCDYPTLMQRRNALVRLVKPDNSHTNDLTTLRYEYTNGRGVPSGTPLEIACTYRDGLGGNITNFYQENIPLQFYAPDVFWQEAIDSAFTLDVALETPYCEIVLRNSEGEYVPLGDKVTPDYATTGSVRELDFLDDGRPIAVGSFTKLCGFAGVTSVAVWEDSAWSTFGTLPGGDEGMSVDGSGPNGVWPPVMGVKGGTQHGLNEYNAGTDTWDLMADSSTYFSVLKWPTKVRRDINGDIYFIVYDDEGLDPVYRLGVLKQGELTVTEFSWGTTISPISGNYVDDIVIGENQVYFLGDFQYDFVGNPDPECYGIVAVNKSDYFLDPVGRGVNGRIRRGWIGEDGFLYVVGDFTKEYYLLDDPGNALRGFARWDGNAWREVISTLFIDDTGPNDVHVDRDGVVWYTMSGSNYDIPANNDYGGQRMLGYKNGVFYPPFIVYKEPTPNGWTTIRNGGKSRNNADLFLLRNADTDPNSIIWLPATNIIENFGDAETLLTIKFFGGTRVSTIQNMEASMVAFREMPNLDTQDYLLINNQGRRGLVYNSQGQLLNRYLAGGFSDLRAIKLFPGINRVQVLSTGTSIGHFAVWRNRYWGLGSFTGNPTNASIVYGPDRTE